MKLRIICDIKLLEDQGEVFLDINFSEIYPDAVEDIPPDMPYPKGILFLVLIGTYFHLELSHAVHTRLCKD